jgi:hypothetical protein
MNRTQLVVVTILFCLAACSSPEITRTRGGGPGADVGNRRQVVNMHEGSKPFDKTPQIISTQHPPLAPASQADQLSRR